MNAVEIEEAISALAEQPFDAGGVSVRLPASLRQQGDDAQAPAQGRVEQVRPGRRPPDQQHPYRRRRRRRGHEDPRRAEGQPGDGQGQGEVRPGDRWRDVRGRGPGERRDGRLRLCRLPGPFRLLPAARRHHHRQAGPRKLLRHPGHQPPEPALCRAAEGQSRLGHGRAPPRHEPLHGAADLLLLRRGHRHLQRHRPVHRHRSSR